MKFDANLARGARAPGPTPGRGAWANIQDLRKAALPLENKLRVHLLDGDDKDHALHMLDAALCYAEALICRFDRNGPPEGLNDLGEMEATLRLALKNPGQFAAFDLEGLKAAIALAKGEKPAAPKKK